MAHVLRPLLLYPRWRHHQPAYSHLRVFQSSFHCATSKHSFFSFFSISYRALHSRSRARSRNVQSNSDADETDDESSSDSGVITKSRNAKKREARQAVKWGMVLASLSAAQIKSIVRLAALEQEVYDAIMLVKGLGRDVREGKRRQYNYIGRLLREVEPELMDDLIKATKEGDLSKFHDSSRTKTLHVDDEEEEEEEEEEESEEDDDEEDFMNISLVTRWYDGLVNKDISITNEIYSLREVEFDRQELRQLVRKVHSTLEAQSSSEENGKPVTAAVKSEKSLTRFLRDLVKQLPP